VTASVPVSRYHPVVLNGGRGLLIEGSLAEERAVAKFNRWVIALGFNHAAWVFL